VYEFFECDPKELEVKKVSERYTAFCQQMNVKACTMMGQMLRIWKNIVTTKMTRFHQKWQENSNEKRITG